MSSDLLIKVPSIVLELCKILFYDGCAVREAGVKGDSRMSALRLNLEKNGWNVTSPQEQNILAEYKKFDKDGKEVWALKVIEYTPREAILQQHLQIVMILPDKGVSNSYHYSGLGATCISFCQGLLATMEMLDSYSK